MPEFTVGVVVRGKITTATADEALELLCAAVRDGIGDEPRRHEIALAAGGAKASDGSPGAMRINEALLKDLEHELTS